MIQGVYRPKQFLLTLEGHARSGEAGKDLVCAGFSALAVTMAENAAAMERRGMLRELEVKLERGHARIRCIPRAGYRASVRLVMDTVAMGMARLAETYSEYARLEVR